MYYSINEITIEDFSFANIDRLYDLGYLFTRKEKGNLYQTRSLRIDLSRFELNSENRRVLRKNAELDFKLVKLPYVNYSWEIHKLGKEFYSKKFGDDTMSASKIKEMFTEEEKSNMNNVFEFSLNDLKTGYCLGFISKSLVHYAYPFYNLDLEVNNLGLGMMIKSILFAKEAGFKYIYLGSIIDQKAKYKLKFKGLEWFNEEKLEWSYDLEVLKARIT
jgi:arginyl-tRNA--protein-N-Asp/Glu arginylyltransferase